MQQLEFMISAHQTGLNGADEDVPHPGRQQFAKPDIHDIAFIAMRDLAGVCA